MEDSVLVKEVRCGNDPRIKVLLLNFICIINIAQLIKQDSHNKMENEWILYKAVGLDNELVIKLLCLLIESEEQKLLHHVRHYKVGCHNWVQ